MSHKIDNLRQEYSSRELNETNLVNDPIEQFGIWFREAQQCEVPEPNAMALATANAQGHPSCRIVLLKGYDERGFVFFTNYLSHKGQDIDSNPFAAITFFWQPMERQVRIEGTIEKVPAAESDHYFHSRPEGSRIGAWASPQSRPISKTQLLENEKQLSEKYQGHSIPRPDHWGGYLVRPAMIEFWQGRPNRLHDRMVFRKVPNGWRIERVAP